MSLKQLGSKSDYFRIEILLIQPISRAQQCQNQTILGLKFLYCNTWRGVYLSQNQTILGLKFGIMALLREIEDRQNQTILGLKFDCLH